MKFFLSTTLLVVAGANGQLISKNPNLSNLSAGVNLSGGATDSKELKECKDALDICMNDEEVPTFLFVQTASRCTLSRSEEGKYVLSSTDLSNETWSFSDRPFQLAESIPTLTFLEEFDTMFHMTDEDTGRGRPNAAFTFIYDPEDGMGDDVLKGPLIAVMIDAAHTVVPDDDDGTSSTTRSASIKVEYDLIQSESQEDSTTLESFFATGDSNGDTTEGGTRSRRLMGRNRGSVPTSTGKRGIRRLPSLSEVKFSSCSLFIDGKR
mmetsp:Transcript_45981/g.112213  ORF Transcript_45981/g.112213 Transcript_45981/m.112213 type:complete len:265 (+) Transcript_45981:1136-1930(+)